MTSKKKEKVKKKCNERCSDITMSKPHNFTSTVISTPFYYFVSYISSLSKKVTTKWQQ